MSFIQSLSCGKSSEQRKKRCCKIPRLKQAWAVGGGH